MRSLLLVVAASLLALASGSCGESAPMSGAQLFEAQCSMCHDRDGAGSQLAPTLQGKKQYWTRESLVKYLVDPQAYAQKDARLRAQGARYTQPMPTYKMLTPEQLGAIAEHVLAMP